MISKNQPRTEDRGVNRGRPRTCPNNGFSGHEPPGWDMQLADTWNRAMRRDLEAALERWMRERDLRGEVCRVTVPGEWMP